MSHPDSVKAEQVDREAAAALEPNGRERDQILRGKRDKTAIVQAFARHRLAALQAAAERERVLVEAVMPFARVAAINARVSYAWPDDKPNLEFLPTAWPDWGDFRRAFEVVGGSAGIAAYDAGESA